MEIQPNDIYYGYIPEEFSGTEDSILDSVYERNIDFNDDDDIFLEFNQNNFKEYRF